MKLIFKFRNSNIIYFLTQREYEDTLRNYTQLKDKIENNFDKLKQIQTDRDEKDKFKKLYERIFK